VTPDLDDRLREIQRRFDAEWMERRWQSKINLPPPPPPGYIRISETDVDDQGNIWVTKYLSQWGSIGTSKIGEMQYVSKRRIPIK
jgi:hypothetical protein